MGNQNYGFRVIHGLLRNRKDVTASTYTVKTGTTTYSFEVDNPVMCDSSGNTIALTVPSGAVPGQTLLIVCETAGNNITVTVTNHANGDAGTTTLDAADEYILLVWTGTEWDTVSYDGCSDIS